MCLTNGEETENDIQLKKKITHSMRKKKLDKHKTKKKTEKNTINFV